MQKLQLGFLPATKRGFKDIFFTFYWTVSNVLHPGNNTDFSGLSLQSSSHFEH